MTQVLHEGNVVKEAMKIAMQNGWKAPSLLKALYMNSLTDETLRGQNVEMVRGMILSHDFAKALWGEEEVDNNGWEIKTIRAWANQVAVKHAGKLVNVDPKQRYVYLMEVPELLHEYELPEDPTAVVQAHKVEYKLEQMMGQVPFETHRLEPLEVECTKLPAWKFHLREIVTAPNAIQYLDLMLPRTKIELKKGADILL